MLTPGAPAARRAPANEDAGETAALRGVAKGRCYGPSPAAGVLNQFAGVAAPAQHFGLGLPDDPTRHPHARWRRFDRNHEGLS